MMGLSKGCGVKNALGLCIPPSAVVWMVYWVCSAVQGLTRGWWGTVFFCVLSKACVIPPSSAIGSLCCLALHFGKRYFKLAAQQLHPFNTCTYGWLSNQLTFEQLKHMSFLLQSICVFHSCPAMNTPVWKKCLQHETRIEVGFLDALICV